MTSVGRGWAVVRRGGVVERESRGEGGGGEDGEQGGERDDLGSWCADGGRRKRRAFCLALVSLALLALQRLTLEPRPQPASLRSNASSLLIPFLGPHSADSGGNGGLHALLRRRVRWPRTDSPPPTSLAPMEPLRTLLCDPLWIPRVSAGSWRACASQTEADSRSPVRPRGVSPKPHSSETGARTIQTLHSFDHLQPRATRRRRPRRTRWRSHDAPRRCSAPRTRSSPSTATEGT